MIAALQQQLPGFAMTALRLCVWLALLVALFVPLERLFAVRRARLLRPGIVTDLGYYFLSSLVPALLLGAPMAIVATAVHAVVPTAFHAWVGALPLGVKIAAALVIGEIGFYWGHRLSHEMPWLWRFHAVHHSAEHMDFLVNTRAHPVDMVFTRLCGLIPLYVVGLAGPGAGGSAVPALVVVIGTLWGFFIHANLRWRLGPLEWLAATPAFHHWHHTRTDHIDRNYASMLPVMDRVFGTYYLPRQWPDAYGTETPMPSSLGGQLVAPWRAGSPATPPAAGQPGILTP